MSFRALVRGQVESPLTATNTCDISGQWPVGGRFDSRSQTAGWRQRTRQEGRVDRSLAARCGTIASGLGFQGGRPTTWDISERKMSGHSEGTHGRG